MPFFIEQVGQARRFGEGVVLTFAVFIDFKGQSSAFVLKSQRKPITMPTYRASPDNVQIVLAIGAHDFDAKRHGKVASAELTHLRAKHQPRLPRRQSHGRANSTMPMPDDTAMQATFDASDRIAGDRSFSFVELPMIGRLNSHGLFPNVSSLCLSLIAPEFSFHKN
ncbi:MAG: hypothetical protein AAFO87_14405 [Cyanobacteria bacterium J06607_6]